jgi:hypothetical protein
MQPFETTRNPTRTRRRAVMTWEPYSGHVRIPPVYDINCGIGRLEFPHADIFHGNGSARRASVANGSDTKYELCCSLPPSPPAAAPVVSTLPLWFTARCHWPECDGPMSESATGIA